jgi:O-antigen/teichoic acid export membrane protein
MEQHSHAQSLIKKILSFSLASWVGAAIAFFVTPIITRVFLPDDFGKINLFVTYVSVIEYLAIIGMHQGYSRFYYDPPKGYNKNALFKFCLLFALAFSLLVCLGIILFGNQLSELIAGEAGPVIPVCLCLNTVTFIFLTMSSMKFRVQHDALRFNVQEILSSIAVKASYLLAAFWGATYSKAIICITVSNLVLTLIFVVVQRRALFERLPKVSHANLWPLIKYSLPTVPAQMIFFVTGAVPLYFLNRYCDFNTVGIFAAALNITVIVRLARMGFSMFWPPYVFENHEKNPEGIQKVHLIFSLGVILFALVVLLFRDPIYLLLGSDYRDSMPFFAFMLANPILYTVAETTGLGISIAKKSELNVVASLVALVVCVLACWILVPLIGALGAAIAMMLGALGQYITQTILGERYYRVITSYIKSFLPLVLLVFASVVNLIFTDALWIRVVILLVGILFLLAVYRRELRYLKTVLAEMVSAFAKRTD